MLLSSFLPDADQKCLESCTKAVSIAPQNPEAHQAMASYLLTKGDLDVRVMEIWGCGYWGYGDLGYAVMGLCSYGDWGYVVWGLWETMRIGFHVLDMLDYGVTRVLVSFGQWDDVVAQAIL